jgi:hypothetical protein
MWLDRAIKWLLPRDDHFFDLLEQGADCALASADLLVRVCEATDETARESLVAAMTDAEHAADQVIHDVYDALNKTFVTPLDRSDIYALSTDMEEISDWAKNTVVQIRLHDMDDLPEGSQEMARHVQRACQEIQAAIRLLRSLKHLEEIRVRCKAINQLEHDGDTIYHAQVGEMFRREKDAVRLMKHKEFLEAMENTLDACDDVANALDAVVIKNA